MKYSDEVGGEAIRSFLTRGNVGPKYLPGTIHANRDASGKHQVERTKSKELG
jgi:hypothetical protein